MKVVIMGCGRVGSELAASLDREGHDIAILDTNPRQFDRFLPETFRGKKIRGNGIDQETLRKAGIREADAFVAVTSGDNRNVMASQIAKHIFKVPRVVCRIYDPIREQMYHGLGLKTISPTIVGANLIKDALREEGPDQTAGAGD